MLKKVCFLLFFSLCFFSLSASEILTLSNGRKIIVNDNFTWEYYLSENDSDTSYKLTKNFVLNNYIQNALKTYKFYYNPNNWIKMDSSSPDAEFMFQNYEATGYFAIIYEGITIPMDSFKKLILMNAVQGYVEPKIIEEANCSVNNDTGKILIYEANVSGMDFTMMNYFTTNTTGSIQVLFWTASYLFDDLKQEFLDTLAGLFF
jgi:hypothetical protein